jgi:hypothetical protein
MMPSTLSSVPQYAQLACDFVSAFDGDAEALGRMNAHYRRSLSLQDLHAEVWRRVYSFRQRAFRESKKYLLLEEARVVVAQDAGFGSWNALIEAAASGGSPGPAFAIHPGGGSVAPARQMTAADWDDLIAVMRERRIASLEANGLITDAALARIAGLDHVKSLNLGGSRELTDDGLQHLARMPQLEHLNLSEYPGGKLTDRGLEVLQHLPNLRGFEMTWQAGITDAGAANLRYCEKLESVNLMGSPTGDGAIEALQGKAYLRRFQSGRLVTDAGLPLLYDFPLLKNWQGAVVAPGAKELPENAGHLLIDGPFTDQGLAGIAGLENVFELDLFWRVCNVTSDGFAHLVHLPNLHALGCDGKLSSDGAMRHIAEMPRLRRLRAQETSATDEGFVALSRSKTLEHLWTRDCEHLGDRGFIALSQMQSLRGIGVSLKNVDDAALAALPDFPSLREITPIGMKDDGFRHVGRCRQIERLTCMYCRETGDAATEHVRNLPLKYYYAGLTQITDRSLEILGGIQSLEQVDLYECKGVTDAGLVFLADLPRLREVHLDANPGITLAGTKVFPARVQVSYST